MLNKVGLITSDENNSIVTALEEILIEIQSNNFTWDPSLEDIHLNIEKSLYDKIGDTAGKLHFGRSRNDLVTTDLRLYLRELSEFIIIRLRNLRLSLAKLAKVYSSDLFPGYTHLQIAQPVVFGHHLLAWAEMFARDETRIENLMSLMNTLPLGSAAMSGTSLKVDRKFVAKKLGLNDGRIFFANKLPDYLDYIARLKNVDLKQSLYEFCMDGYHHQDLLQPY